LSWDLDQHQLASDMYPPTSQKTKPQPAQIPAPLW
jgi:hypothetical protein